MLAKWQVVCTGVVTAGKSAGLQKQSNFHDERNQGNVWFYQADLSQQCLLIRG